MTTVPKLSGFNCPNCGAAVEMRTFGQAVSVVCPSCHSVLDAKDPNFAVLQKAQSIQTIQPKLPLGSRGRIEDGLYEIIGFQVRTENDPDDGPDSWHEYLLYNPYLGYRYLTDYEENWNFVRVASAIPEPQSGGSVRMLGTTFQQKAQANAATTYVIGEFPWAVRVGDSAYATDYAAGNQILSSETTPDETVWSLGHSIDPTQIRQAFGLINPSTPAAPPVPHGPTLWPTALKLLGVGLLLSLFFQGTGGKQVYRQSVSLGSGTQVTPSFEVPGSRSNLAIEAKNRGDQSFYMHYALVSETTGQAVSFARSIGKEDEAIVPSVEPGRYLLRMEAEQPGSQIDLTVRRHVASFGFFWFAAVLLLLPPILQLWRRITSGSRGGIRS